MKTLAVIIPMCDEEANAERCVRSICRVITEKLSDSMLFTVNDGSRDGTLRVLLELAKLELPFKVVSYEPHRGYGEAVLAGMCAAHDAGFVFGLVMDADLTNDPELIPVFEAKLAEGMWDVVKASRYAVGGGMQGVPTWRQMYSMVGNRIAYRLFRMGIRDCTNGFHAVRLSMVVNGSFIERGFPFLLEELYHLKRQGARGTEIPYTLTARQEGEGESKFSYSLPVLWSYLKYALKAAVR